MEFGLVGLDAEQLVLLLSGYIYDLKDLSPSARVRPD